MEREKLFCDSCKKVWSRTKTRGRKPRICPNCVAQIIIDQQEEDVELSVVQEDSPAPTKYPPNTKWHCPSCRASVKICIGINYPPTHQCPKRLRRVYQLEMI